MDSHLKRMGIITLMLSILAGILVFQRTVSIYLSVLCLFFGIGLMYTERKGYGIASVIISSVNCFIIIMSVIISVVLFCFT